MNPEFLERIRGYSEAVSIARLLMRNGLIEYSEFLFIEEKIAAKYGFSKYSAFREIT